MNRAVLQSSAGISFIDAQGRLMVDSERTNHAVDALLSSAGISFIDLQGRLMVSVKDMTQ